jgi:hypothetical protein
MRWPRIARQSQVTIGVVLLLAMTLPPIRHLLEQSMQLHMLAQYPLLMISGALLARGVPEGIARKLATCNAMGITGLAAAMLFTTVLMIPRVLDLVLVDARVELAKFAALLIIGALFQASWRSAGTIVQAFFLGGILPMMIVVGTIYQSAPLRLCNAYRLDDQQNLGWKLVWLSAAVAAVWLVQTTRRLMTSEAGS